MTPWGIRNRIKSALGRAPGAAAEKDDRLDLTIILPDGSSHEVRCEPRYTLVMASQSLETPLATHCPDGHCGNCVVDVLVDQGLSTPTSAESKLLAEKGHRPGQRLACHAKIVGSGAKVRGLSVWTMDSVRGET